MVLDAVSNFVRGNTDAEVGTSDTTVSVADASIFPDPETDGEFNVVIWDVNNFPRPDQDGDVEILRVTERDTTADELTVTRGQEMTSAAAHPEGSAIHLSPTAKMFSDIESTFGDFWDAGTQELTADVNNTNTTTTSLETESLVTGGWEVWDGEGSLQNAIDGFDGHSLIVPAGEYDPVTINDSLRLVGPRLRLRDSSQVAIINGSSDNPAITIDSDDIIIDGFCIGSASDGIVVNDLRCRVKNCLFAGDGEDLDGISNDAIRVEDSNQTDVLQNKFRTRSIGGDEVVLSSDSEECLVDSNGGWVDGNVSIVDNGTDNVVGDNA